MYFSSAHNLRGYKGKCEDLHGHNWKVVASLAKKKLDKTGMVLDFKDLKMKLNSVLETLDHKYLNDTPYFKKVNRTPGYSRRAAQKSAFLPHIGLRLGCFQKFPRFCLSYIPLGTPCRLARRVSLDWVIGCPLILLLGSLWRGNSSCRRFRRAGCLPDNKTRLD